MRCTELVLYCHPTPSPGVDPVIARVPDIPGSPLQKAPNTLVSNVGHKVRPIPGIPKTVARNICTEATPKGPTGRGGGVEPSIFGELFKLDVHHRQVVCFRNSIQIGAIPVGTLVVVAGQAKGKVKDVDVVPVPHIQGLVLAKSGLSIHRVGLGKVPQVQLRTGLQRAFRGPEDWKT